MIVSPVSALVATYFLTETEYLSSSFTTMPLKLNTAPPLASVVPDTELPIKSPLTLIAFSDENSGVQIFSGVRALVGSEVR